MTYYFHWSYEDAMNMEHQERRKWCEEISQVNEQINHQTEKSIEDYR